MDAPVSNPILFSRFVSLKRQDANDSGMQRPKTVKKNNIYYNLSRMYPNIVGPRKRK